MKCKFGAIVVDGRNKLGGHVASKNRAGAYWRTKVTPMNPNSPYQAEVRNRLSTLSSAWRGLGADVILQWNSAVDLFKSTDIFGDVRRPTGFNLYQMLNNNLVRIGIAPITTPPLPVALPVIITGVVTAVAATSLIVTFTEDPVITASEVEVWATPALSVGKSFVKSEFRRIGLMPAIVSNVATLTTLYNAKFGAVGAAGLKLFIKMQQISKTTGQAGIPVIYSCEIS
ncbi:MAG: hypothetical protein Q7J06_01340 [Bacteroidales bacterium]|nr:hypothetical protein [Bacteroidales bacterium]